MEFSNKLLIEDEEDFDERAGSNDIGGRNINMSGSIGNEYFINSRLQSKEFRSLHGGINQSTSFGDSTIIVRKKILPI
jgi:hypothetical protein